MKLVLLFFLVVMASCLRAQDINFSQFYELPLLRNPALAGIYKGTVRVTSAIRSQWGSVTVPFISQAVGAEIRFAVPRNSDNYLSVGLQLTNERAGDSKLGKTQFLPVVTFNKSLSSEKDTYLSLGFMGGIVQQRFDPTHISFDDQFINGAYSQLNPTQQTFSRTDMTYVDGSVGLSFSSTVGNEINYYLGSAYFHFTQPKVAFNQNNDIRLNNKIVFNLGASFPTSDFDKFIIYVDYFNQGGHRQSQGGFMWKHDLIQNDEDEAISISTGAFLRWNDAAIPLIKLDYYKLGIGVSYDVNISKLSKASQSRGGFEITLSFKNYLNNYNSSASKMGCPKPVD